MKILQKAIILHLILLILSHVSAEHYDYEELEPNEPSEACMYCKRKDTIASFMYSYSYCRTKDLCLED